MRHAGAGTGKQINFRCIQLHTMRMPDIISCPSDGIGIVTWAHAKGGKAVINILDILGKMRMQTDSQMTCKSRTFPHQVYRYRKGRTGGERHTLHGMTVGIVKGLHHTLTIGKNGVFIFAQAVRRQSALALTNAHRTARSVETHSNISSCRHGVIKARAIWKKIEMV